MLNTAHLLLHALYLSADFFRLLHLTSQQQTKLYANTKSHNAAHCLVVAFEYLNGGVLDRDVAACNLHTVHMPYADTYSMFANMAGGRRHEHICIFIFCNIGPTRRYSHVLARRALVNNASFPCLINSYCTWPVSEPESPTCESPTYVPLNQIGNADKPYLHSGVAGRDYYQ